MVSVTFYVLLIAFHGADRCWLSKVSTSSPLSLTCNSPTALTKGALMHYATFQTRCVHPSEVGLERSTVCLIMQ